jgi:hypothetical protein
MSWQEAARDISGLFDRTAARAISASTLTGLRNRHVVEGDGVLQMLRWLNRTPESFALDAGDVGAPAALPSIERHQILRFDTKKIFAELEAKRAGRGITWTQVAREIGGTNAAALTRLSKGGRTSFPGVMRIARWLGRPVASFVRVSAR